AADAFAPRSGTGFDISRRLLAWALQAAAQPSSFAVADDGATAFVARLRMLITATGDQGTPLALGTPRALSARATPRSVVPPLACISLMIGMTFAAKLSVLALLAAAPSADASSRFGPPSFVPRSFA